EDPEDTRGAGFRRGDARGGARNAGPQGRGRGEFLNRAGEASAVTIRLATAEDAPVLHALMLELAAATGRAGKVTGSPEAFRQHAALFDALLAERSGRPLGFCLFFTSFSSWRGEPGIYIQDLYVAEEA